MIERNENGKSNLLVVFLVIVILILCGVICYLAFNLGKENSNVENNGDNDVVDQNGSNNHENSIEELSLNDTEVKKIIDKFNLDFGSKATFWYSTYEDEKLSDSEILELAYVNSKNLIHKESKCNENAYGGGDGIYYTCEYIEYDDLNKSYNELTDQTLAKKDLGFLLTKLVYDADDNVYRNCEIAAGGGSDWFYIEKLDKAYQSGEYIYIYQNVAIIDTTGYIFSPKNYEYVEYDNEQNSKYTTSFNFSKYNNGGYWQTDQIIEDYIDSYGTYKWTFKKGTNGEYVYESLEYVNE